MNIAANAKKKMLNGKNHVDQILGVLLSFAVKRGRVFPSLDTIARMAMCQQQHRAPRSIFILYGFLDRTATHHEAARSAGAARCSD